MAYFIELAELNGKPALPGATVDFIQTQNLTIGYSELKAGAEIPLHQHLQEATDIVLEGVLEMQIGETVDVLKWGMISLVPSNMPHRARAITDCKVVTVLHPQRDV